MMSLYAKYIQERENRDIIEVEHGFLTYRLYPDELYVEDVFTEPKFRRMGIALSLLREAEQIARNTGRQKISTTVRPSANGSTESLKAILANGFELKSALNDGIYFVKGV